MSEDRKIDFTERTLIESFEQEELDRILNLNNLVEEIRKKKASQSLEDQLKQRPRSKEKITEDFNQYLRFEFKEEFMRLTEGKLIQGM